LAKIAAILVGVSGHPVEVDPGRRGYEQIDNPIPKYTREATLLEKINDIIPTHRVEPL
jgi:hypothetical protein